MSRGGGFNILYRWFHILNVIYDIIDISCDGFSLELLLYPVNDHNMSQSCNNPTWYLTIC